jgi:ATP-dependent helicase HrpB
VFLPGAPEIRRLAGELNGAPLPGRPSVVLPLHGSLDADAQDAALAPTSTRKVILATNLAETSLTVDGVTDVIDTGRHKVLRYDPAVAVDRLETERISRDAAEQRAGRAGRTGPGRVRRLWDPRDLLRARREPEIERVDLAAPFLEVIAWGGDPARFEWFEAPHPDRAAIAIDLLERLGAISNGRITRLGETLRAFSIPPRLARVLVDAGGSPAAAASSRRAGSDPAERRSRRPTPMSSPARIRSAMPPPRSRPPHES